MRLFNFTLEAVDVGLLAPRRLGDGDAITPPGVLDLERDILEQI